MAPRSIYKPKVTYYADPYTVYVPIDAHCASADLRVRVYLKKIFKKKIKNLLAQSQQ